MDAFSQNLILLVNLRHKNIRKILDIFVKDSLINAAFEIPGPSLQKVIDEYNGLEEPVCRRIAFDVLQAIAYVHTTSVYLNLLSPNMISVDFTKCAKINQLHAATRGS